MLDITTAVVAFTSIMSRGRGNIGCQTADASVRVTILVIKVLLLLRLPCRRMINIRGTLNCYLLRNLGWMRNPKSAIVSWN